MGIEIGPRGPLIILTGGCLSGFRGLPLDVYFTKEAFFTKLAARQDHQTIDLPGRPLSEAVQLLPQPNSFIAALGGSLAKSGTQPCGGHWTMVWMVWDRWDGLDWFATSRAAFAEAI